jgi:hypothetical protein
VAGAIGGNVVGAMLRHYNLGPLGNSIAGILGGGLGGEVPSMILGGGLLDGDRRHHPPNAGRTDRQRVMPIHG